MGGYIFTGNPSDLDDAAKAWELTRHINEVQYPVCADYDLRKAIPTWLTGKGFNSLDAWNEHRLRKGRALSKKRAHQEDEDKDEDEDCIECFVIQQMTADIEAHREQQIDEDWSHAEQTSTQSSKMRSKAPLGQARHHMTETRLPFDPRAPRPDTPEYIDPHRKHLFQEFPEYGPSSATWDILKSMIWDLFTHAGFVTYSHHDANGFGTFMYIRHGCKIWANLRPRVPTTHTKIGQLLDILRTILRPAPAMQYTDKTDMFTMFLLPGDVLIQPPNAIHIVYTPVNCLSGGGHYLTYETLHLVEISRRLDRHYGHISTNSDHPILYHTLCRMLIALLYLWNTRG